MTKALQFVIVVSLLAFSPPPEKKVRLYLIGDSTMCLYEAARAPLTGWGMPFALFFDSSVVVNNAAKGGRSTRSFLAEGRWKPIVDSLQPGDYVLIQFGHNDEAKEDKYKDRYTPVPDYKRNLQTFIRDSRQKGAIPVLITPVTRMRFSATGQAEETHADYTAAMKALATEERAVLIDLDGASRELLQSMGPEAARLLYMQLAPGEHPNYPDGQKDNTHFSEYGARRIATLVLAGIRTAVPALAARIVKPVRN